MPEIKIPNARSNEEKDTPEIIVVASLVPMVLLGTLGFYLWGPMGAIVMAPLGAGVGGWISYQLTRKNNHIARDMKFDHRE